MDSATATGVETTSNNASSASQRRTEETKKLQETSDRPNSSDGPAQKTLIRKYRHVAAIHSQARPSTLSHDTQVSPSFVGFRNLMVIVLGNTEFHVLSVAQLNFANV